MRRGAALRLPEIAGRGQENLGRGGGRRGLPGDGRQGRGDRGRRGVGTTGEEDDGTGIVVRGVGRAVQQLVQRRARGEHREGKHERGPTGREEAAEEIDERSA